MRDHLVRVIALTSSLILIPSPSLAASNAPGANCAHIGLVAKSGAVNVKCTKSGKRLSWQKIDDAEFAKFTPSGPTKKWDMVISSNDGTRLTAMAGNRTYISTNTGVTWTTHQNGLGNVWFNNFTSSNDGKSIIAASGGNIYSSSNSGVTWASHPIGLDLQSPYFVSFGSIASSSDGQNLVAVGYGGDGPVKGPIYRSTDAGASWTEGGPSGYWRAVASSSDGKKLVAAEAGGQIYTSSDSGVTWTAHVPSGYWSAFVRSIVSSSDGSRLTITSDDQGGIPRYRVYTSLDSGATWTAHGPIGSWSGLASSKDGATLVANWCDGNTKFRIYTSTDSGTTWTARASTATCWGLNALSGDGRILAASYGGQIHVVHK